MRWVSEALMVEVPRSSRICSFERLIMPWRLPAWPCLILPPAVNRKRFLAPDLVFSLGILHLLGALDPGRYSRAATACPDAGRPERGAVIRKVAANSSYLPRTPLWSGVPQKLPYYFRRFARWVFLPALAVVVWGELKPSTPGPDGWDKVLH